jgi:class 3 adenylate cyclase/tetratricopeptide (TPR) repeat protein
VSAAERRQLTVVFVDLVASTALSAQLDPEEMRDVLRAYQNAVTGEIARIEGHVAKLMGDGVLAYFGWPRAHEDEAERAVRAGLAVIEAVERLSAPSGEPLACRVGIATGLVVVGDLVGEGAAREEAVVGETPNLAARLQHHAEPGTVVIADGTRRHLGKLFELRALGATQLKGFEHPVSSFQVLREHATSSRFEAQRSSRVLPMVGRDQELALVLDRWQQAGAGEGQAMLLVGEAGIGKSRLVQAMLDVVAGGENIILRYQCSPHHTGTALWPIIQQLRFAAGLVPADTETANLDKLEVLLRQAAADIDEAVPLIATLLGIDAGQRYTVLNLSPQQQRARTLVVLVEQLLGLARRRPVLMVVEDTHWIDPTTLELLGQALDRIAGARVLMLLTSRPDNQPSLGGHPHVTRLTLNRLGRTPTEAIVAGLTGGASLLPEVLEEIAARTDGVPLFVEELTKAVLETGTTGSGGAVPTSLHASLMARLDRVPDVKEVAQTAACIGREFAYPLLAEVSPLPEAELQGALDRLANAELVFRRGMPPEASYTFKHALVRDAAHESLLKTRRQQLHARIVQALEAQFPEVATAQPELLAHHCAEGGLIERAVDYWFAAGERALRASANVEAVQHLSQGIRLLTTSLPDTPGRQRTELQFQISLGATLLATRGWAASEAVQAYRRADELCRALGDHRERFKVVLGLWFFYLTRGETQEAKSLGDELFALAEQQNDDDLRLQALHAAWGICTWLGEFAAGREHAERGLALYSPAKHASHALTYGGHDPGVCGWARGGMDLWFLGYPDQADEYVHRAVALAEEIGHPPTVAHALNYGILCQQFRRDAATVRSWGERMACLAAEHGLALFGATAIAAHGWVLADEGQVTGSLSELRRGMEGCIGLGMRLFEPYHKALLAEAYLAVGDGTAALGLVEDAMRFAEESGVHFWDAELLRLKGRLLTRLSPPGANPQEVEACYRGALEIARSQDSRSLELRGAFDLAGWWRDQGRRSEAHDLLAPIYGWFTEGFDTPDLREAKVLLDKLRD